MVTETPSDAIDILSEIPAGGAASPTASDATLLDTGPVSATTDLYRAAIGKVNTDFYQRVFEQLESAERAGPTWNWAAALLTVNWMVFRQLWSAVLLYAGAVVVALISVLGLGRLVLHWSAPVETGLLALLALLAVVVPGAFGNAWLHAASRKKMEAALAANTTVPEACAMLEAHASGKSRLIWIALANALVAGATVGMSLALPDADRLAPISQAPATVPALPIAAAPTNVASAPVLPASEIPSTAASAPAAEITIAAAPAMAPVSAATAALAPAIATVQAPTPPAVALPAAQTATSYSTVPAPAVLSAPPVPQAPATPQTTEKPTSSATRFSTRDDTQVPPKTAAKTAAKPRETPTKTGKAKTATEPASVEATNSKKIYINVGLFAKEINARNAHDKLAKAGLPAKEQQVTGTKGTFTRVRVGPYKTLAQAEKAAEKIRAQGLDAVVAR